jgi:hypothetical protein
MRRSVARNHPAYRGCGPQQEGPTPSILGGLLDAARGKPSIISLQLEPRQELAFLSGSLVPARTSRTSLSNSIIQLFCAGFHQKGACHVRTRAKSNEAPHSKLRGIARLLDVSE